MKFTDLSQATRWMSSLRSDEVRSLAWVIGSAPLMSNDCSLPIFDKNESLFRLSEAADWLSELDLNDSQLIEHLAKRPSWKVGYRFESLVEYWLINCPTLTCLHTNYQVLHENGRTLGAFDFILQNNLGGFEHWEVAIKFYLLHGSGQAWDQWIGPGRRDRLDKKLLRMMNHQLPLSDTKQGKQALRSMNIEKIQKKRALIKGMFFRPWKETSQGPRHTFHPDFLGFWLNCHDVRQFVRKHQAARFAIRNKPDWISPTRCTGEISISGDDLSQHEFSKPVMISLLRPMQDIFFETQRFFVVPSDWRESL